MPLRTLVICHAPVDAAPARQLAEFLATNLAVEISFDTSLPLLDAVERAISAPFALVLFSPASVPATWVRSAWEPVFLKAPEEFGAHLGFALLADCKFPELLRRERFFDFTRSFLEPARLVKQWMMHPGQVPRRIFGHAELRATLADRPGSLHGLDSASPFLTECDLDFEQVVRLDANGRTPAGIIGETGHLLGVSLKENADRNRELLVEDLAQHRALLIYDNLPEQHLDLVAFGGLATVITTTGPSPVNSDPDFATLPERLEVGLRAGWEVCEYLDPLQRYAEKIEVLRLMLEVAQRKGLSDWSIKHELSFMLDDNGPGISIPHTASAEVRQLDLF